MISDPIKVSNGIYLFKKALSNPDKAYSFALKSKNGNDKYFNSNTWENWQPWGNKSACYITNTDGFFNNLNSYQNKDLIDGIDLQRECSIIFNKILKWYEKNQIDNGYFDRYNFDKKLPLDFQETLEYRFGDFVLFESNLNNQPDWHMRPHQDNHKWWGTNRQVFNCNIYLNDDFEGGEIQAYEFDKNTLDYVDKFSGKPGKAWIANKVNIYKIEAGDALLLETDAWHGVLPMRSGSKYYVRQIISYNKEHEEMIKYKKSMSLEEYEIFYKNEFDKNNKLRISPILFNSLDDIDIDSPRFAGESSTVVPFIIDKTSINSSVI